MDPWATTDEQVTQAPADAVGICELCGDYLTLDDPGTNGICIACFGSGRGVR